MLVMQLVSTKMVRVDSVLMNYHFQAMVKARFDVEPEYQNLFFQVNFLLMSNSRGFFRI